MEEKKYFYKDSSGKMCRFVHCMRGCPEAYTQDQIDIDIFKVSNHSYICSKCYRELDIGKLITSSKLPSTVSIVASKEPVVPDEVPTVEELHEITEELEEEIENSKSKFFDTFKVHVFKKFT